MKRISPIAVVVALAICLAGSGAAQVVAVPGTSPSPGDRNVSGTVTDSSGAPAVDVEVAILPALGANRGFRTDAQGRYSLDWRPVQVNVRGAQAAQLNFLSGITYSVMARDQSRNLVAVGGLDASASNMDLQLQTGLTLSGSVADADGKPVSTATIQLNVITGNIGSSFNRQPIRVDSDGAFNVPALPRGMQYNVNVRADGYGSSSSQIPAAQTSTDQLKLPACVLRLANLSLAGQVLDADGHPVPNAQVQANGPGQPNSTTTTDARGHFELKVCAGQVQVVAFPQSGVNRTASVVQAQGGDTSVVIRLGANLVIATINGLRQAITGSPLLLRNGEPKPPIMTWDYFKTWPAMHKTAIRSIAVCQLLVLLAVGAGIFWVVRRGRAVPDKPTHLP